MQEKKVPAKDQIGQVGKEDPVFVFFVRVVHLNVNLFWHLSVLGELDIIQDPA
jgi:hypothetical protein